MYAASDIESTLIHRHCESLKGTKQSRLQCSCLDYLGTPQLAVGSVIRPVDFASWIPPQGVGYRKADSQKTNPVFLRLVDLRNLNSSNGLNRLQAPFSTGFVSSLFCFLAHVVLVRHTLRVGYRVGQRLTNADARENDSESVGKVWGGNGSFRSRGQVLMKIY